MSNVFVFNTTDLNHEVPEPGYYPATITSVRIRTSYQGNQMLHVVFMLQDVPEGYQRVSDYFVLEGASSSGVATARRRLVRLCRACGLEPYIGDEIPVKSLRHSQLQVRIVHDQYQGEVRLKVVAYRLLAPGQSSNSL